MRAQENGASVGAPAPNNQTADALPALYQIATLTEAAAALVSINEAGLLAELHDAIAAEWHAFKTDPDRKWRYDSSVGFIQTVGRELAHLTGAPLPDCTKAIASIVDPQWTQIACAAIVAFAERLPLKWRASA